MTNPKLSIIITAYSCTNVGLFSRYFKYFFYKDNDDKDTSPWVIHKNDDDFSINDVYEYEYDKDMKVEYLDSLNNVEFLLVIDNKGDNIFNIDYEKYKDIELVNKFNNTNDINIKQFKNITNKIFKNKPEKCIYKCECLYKYFENKNDKLNKFYNKIYEILNENNYDDTDIDDETKFFYEDIINFVDIDSNELFYKINTVNLINEFENTLKLINFDDYKIIYSNTPSSLSTSRNIGAKESTGDWLMFFDDDDPHININVLYNTLIKYKYKEVCYDKNYAMVDETSDEIEYKKQCDVISCYLNTLDKYLKAVWGRFYKKNVFETFNNNCSYYNEDYPFKILIDSYFNIYDVYGDIKYMIVSYKYSNQYDNTVTYNDIKIDIDYINAFYITKNIKYVYELHKNNKDDFNYMKFINMIYNNILSTMFNYYNPSYGNTFFIHIYIMYNILYNEKLDNIIKYNSNIKIPEENNEKYTDRKKITEIIKEMYYNQNQVQGFTIIEPNKEKYTIYHSAGNNDKKIIDYMYNHGVGKKIVDHPLTNEENEHNMKTINEFLDKHKETRYNLLGGFISLILLLLKITILIIIVCVIVLIFKQVKISSEN